ncbi:transposase [Streptomyces sp. NPDC007901]|uniref:transposase n=1 Tax=Streptomyces sp. NPDC007901 TaxID=3364785 RepID=UPI0036EBC7B7
MKREGTNWYVVLACGEVPAEPLPPTGAIVGIDMGVAHFLTTSDGEHVANPRFLQAVTEELAEVQRYRVILVESVSLWRRGGCRLT